MATFAEIAKANEAVKTTPIKGKDYVEVNQRVKAFRMVYPDGFIIPEMLSNENGVCVFRATVGYYDESGNSRVLGAGTAYEKEGSTMINKTSYIENCETSAVGRALGMAGFGIDTSIASADEVATAIANQQPKSAEAESAQSEYERKHNTPASDDLKRAIIAKASQDQLDRAYLTYGAGLARLDLYKAEQWLRSLNDGH